MRKLIIFSIIATLVIVSSQTFVPNSYSSKLDYFLEIDGVEGSSSIQGKEGWIMLDAVKYGESNLDSIIKSASQATSQLNQMDTLGLTLIKQVDKSTPILFDALASGKNLGSGEINICDESQCAVKLALADIKVTEYSINATSADSVKESIVIKFSSIGLKQDTNIPDTNTTSTNVQAIPGWIKNNAKWFADGSIGESDFTKGIEYMIKEKIMNIAKLPAATPGATETKVPDWIKNNAKWWSEGQIDDNSFVQGIQYLVEHGIIRVN